jgi:prepilin-type N-terminal cleavage/methylation domain-containing protein
MNDFRKDKGFTLVEILMAVFIGLILLGAVYVTLNSGQRSSAGVERKVAAQQDVRAALEIMSMEISMASFNPNFMPTGIWKIPPPLSNACTGASANQSYKGLQEVTPYLLTVEMDITKDGIIGPPANNEIIRYAYDTASQSISRFVCQGDGTTVTSSFLGNGTGAAEGTRTVRVINNTLPIKNENNVPAIFRYYDSKSAPLLIDTSTNTNTNLIPNIRRIDITLGVETEEVDPSTHQKKQMTYSTSVLVRNHVLN